MTVDVPAPELVALLLATVRAAAWLVVAPPFAGSSMPAPARAVLALGLALPSMDRLAPTIPDLSTPGFVGAVALQVLTGVSLGFLVSLLFAAFRAAGDLIDLSSGFTLASAYDPLSMTTSSVFGRMHTLLATTLLFTTNAHLVVLGGFLRSYDALPVTEGISVSALGPALVSGLTSFFLAAVQIAAPLIVVLFLADVGLGLLTRVSPTLNAFSMGFPIKIMLSVLLIGMTYPLLPDALTVFAEDAFDVMDAVVTGGG